MNSLVSVDACQTCARRSRCNRRRAFTAACGSGSGSRITPLGGSFSRASLKGQYVMAHTGTAINQLGTSADPFSETLVFSADGAGNLTVTVDDFDQDGQLLNPTLPETGTYVISSDGTGSISVGGACYAITMIDDGHFYVMEQDGGATSSGYGELQDTTAFTAPPSGNYVFKSHKVTAIAVNPSARVGGITIASRLPSPGPKICLISESPRTALRSPVQSP